MRLRILFLFSCLLAVEATAASHFDELADTFQKSAQPAAKDVDGYWAGRCVAQAAPDEPQPAVFVFKVINDPNEFPPQRATLSYFYKQSANKALYDTMSASQVQADPDVKAWFAQEQWRKAEAQEGSLTNAYLGAGNVVYQRAVRFYQDEFNKQIVLRVTRQTATASDVTTYCHFGTALGQGTVNPTPATFTVGQLTGALSGVYDFFNTANAATAVQSVHITNLGARAFTVDGVALFRAGAVVAQSNVAAYFQPGGTLAYTAPYPFTFDRAQVRVRGRVDFLQLWATTAVSPTVTGIPLSVE